MSDGKTLTLSVNKSKHLIKYRGKWIPASDFYKKGYEDANIAKKCVDCGKELDGFYWECQPCRAKRNVAMAEIVGEVMGFLGGKP